MAKTIEFKSLILWETEDYIAINKPSGISSLTERDLKKVSILGMAKAYHQDAQLCHRIDKDTTGVLIIAKKPEAYRNLSIQFENREVDKLYHAVVDGVHHFQDTLVDLPISQNTKGMVRIDPMLGKFAETTFNTLAVYRRHTLVECAPMTGRMHQIRIHLASLQAPIVCDTSYGGSTIYLSDFKKHVNIKRDTKEQPLIKRFALHAYQIEFNDCQGNRQQIQAPYPKDLRALVRQLEKYAR